MLYQFTGFQPTFFNGLRDSEGRQLGYISPGDVIDTAEVPDGAAFVLVTGDSANSAHAENAPAVSVPETPEPVQEIPQPVVPAFDPGSVNPAAQVIVH